MQIKTISPLFRRYLVIFLIFNHLFVFCPQAMAVPHADARHLDDFFGEEIASHILRKARHVSVRKEVRNTSSPRVGSSQDIDVTKGSSGAYCLQFDPSEDQAVINFYDSGKSVGTWIQSQGHGFFIGSKEESHDIDIQSPLTLCSLKVVMSGRLRFLQAVTLKENADIESDSLSIVDNFSSQGSSQFAVQETMEVLSSGCLISEQGIIARCKSFFNRGSIAARDALFLESEDFSNNGMIEGAQKFVLKSTALVNRAYLKAKTLMMDVKKGLSNISGSSIEVMEELRTTYTTFENMGSVKVGRSFFSKGERFENKRSGSSVGTLEVGSLYQANVHTYIDSGINTWNGLTLIRAQIADLVGRYTCASASMIADKSIIARGGSKFQVSHFLELKSEDGTLDFAGDLFLNSTVKKPVFPKGSSFALLVARMPHLIRMEGCKKLTQRGNIVSTSSSISYSSEGKFDLMGRSRSGVLGDNTTTITAQHAQLDGILEASGDIILLIKEKIHIAGKVAARNLKAMVQDFLVSGSILTVEDAVLKPEKRAEITKTGSLKIGKALVLTSDGDVMFDGVIHAHESTVQANTITNTGSFSVDTLAHFKADTYFANLWRGGVDARDIQIDAALSLNLLSRLNATCSLTTNALVDLNLLGVKTAHYITSSSLFSLDVGLSLPSLHPSALLSWESAMRGLRAAALSLAPTDVRSVFNLGFAAYNLCYQASTLCEKYKKYSSLDDKARFSEIIPLLVGIKDLGLATYTTAKNIGGLVSRASEEAGSQLKSETQKTPSFMPTMDEVAGAAISVFMPRINQDALFSINAGISITGDFTEHAWMSLNYGRNVSWNYTSSSYYMDHRSIHMGNTFRVNAHKFIGGGRLMRLHNIEALAFLKKLSGDRVHANSIHILDLSNVMDYHGCLEPVEEFSVSFQGRTYKITSESTLADLKNIPGWRVLVGQGSGGWVSKVRVGGVVGKAWEKGKREVASVFEDIEALAKNPKKAMALLQRQFELFSGHNGEETLFLGKGIQAAYEKDKKHVESFCRAKNLTLEGFLGETKGHAVGFMCTDGNDPKKLYIFTRGTWNDKDFKKYDADIEPNRGKHRGFKNFYEEYIEREILSRLESGRFKEVVMGGHSLGGAALSIGAISLAERHNNIKFHLTTFGAPANFEKRAMEQVVALLGGLHVEECGHNLSINRIYRDEDIITHEQHNHYKHIGKPLKLASLESVARLVKLFVDPGVIAAIGVAKDAHSLDEYVRDIAWVNKTAEQWNKLASKKFGRGFPLKM